MGMVSTRNSQIRKPEPGVSGVGQRHQELTPMNPRLWKIVVIQAKAKFHKWPSPAASHWAHEKYKQLGGKFKAGGKDDDKAKRLASHQRMQKDRDEEAEERREKSRRKKKR